MTRIISGAARGRRLSVPPKGTRPTTDRVREAVFSALAARIDVDGAAVLDLYAGSGALGLEALSRGASRVLLVDQDARATAVAKSNIGAIGLPGAAVRRGTVGAVLGGTPEPYDLVFLDPPYDVPATVVDGDLAALADGWLAPDALVVLERSARTPAAQWPAGFDPEWTREYGETRIEIALWQDDST